MRMKPAFEIRERSRVYVGPVGDLLAGALPEGRVVVVTDATVERLFAPLLAPYERLLVGQGEASKTLRTVGELYERLIDLGADRSTFILGVGGGIVTDVAGFVASTNMAGCFAQPDFVVCDPAMLRPLPDREFRAGLAEMVKAALIADGDLFAALERSSFAALREAPEQLRDLITAAIRVKADIVGRDERERGERRKLNLGHTLAHAIEKCSDRMNHGEAVAVGIALMAGAARRLGLLDAAQCDRIVGLLERLGFDLQPPVPLERLLREAGHDKKNEQGTLHIVLPAGIGDCVVRDIPTAEFATLFTDAR